MEWISNIEKPAELIKKVRFNSDDLDISLAIHDSEGHQRFKHLSFAICSFSEDTIEELKQSWPREALAKARRRLDEFEEFLNEEEKCETNLEKQETDG